MTKTRMEMLTNDGDISMSMMNEQEPMSKDEKTSYMREWYIQIIQYSITCTK